MASRLIGGDFVGGEMTVNLVIHPSAPSNMGCLKRQVYLYMVPNLLNQHYMKAYFLIEVIIRCNFFFLFIGLEPTTWPANNCLQIMVCSCATSSTCVWLSVWLQIIFCSCVNERTLFSLLRSLLRENGSFPKIFIKKLTRWLNDKTIIELGGWHCAWADHYL